MKAIIYFWLKDLKNNFIFIILSCLFLIISAMFITIFTNDMAYKNDEEFNEVWFNEETVSFSLEFISKDLEKYDESVAFLKEFYKTNNDYLVRDYYWTRDISIDYEDQEVVFFSGNYKLINGNIPEKDELLYLTNQEAAHIDSFYIDGVNYNSSGLIPENLDLDFLNIYENEPAVFVFVPKEQFTNKYSEVYDDGFGDTNNEEFLSGLINYTLIPAYASDSLEEFNRINEIGFYYAKPLRIIHTPIIYYFLDIIFIMAGVVAMFLLNVLMQKRNIQKMTKEYTVHVLYGATKKQLLTRALLLLLVPTVITYYLYNAYPILHFDFDGIGLGQKVCNIIFAVYYLALALYIMFSISRADLHENLRRDNL